MELEFQTKITTNILFDYMLHHTYNSPSGILGGGIGSLLVIGFFGTQNILYLLAGLVLLFYLPCSLYLSSMKQMQNTLLLKNLLPTNLTKKAFRYPRAGRVSFRNGKTCTKLFLPETALLYTIQK